MKALIMNTYVRSAVACAVALSLSAGLVGCSDEPTVKPKPVVVPDAGAVDSGGQADASADSGPNECTEFATENERLLNAPTDSVGIKKKVVLPTGP
jgi:hypothetical protein